MKKKLLIGLSVFLILLDAAAVFILLRSRYVSHMAFCSIHDSSSAADFDWSPYQAPAGFVFEQGSSLSGFREEIKPFVEGKNDAVEISFAAADYINFLCFNGRSGKPLVWADPGGILRQAKQGASGIHCFHRSILLSEFLSSLGIRSRIWALEGAGFDGKAHTVNEIYSERMGKWILVDCTNNCYAREGDTFLSCLELRRKILSLNAADVSFFDLKGRQIPEAFGLTERYGELMPCVLLRCRNDFLGIYKEGRAYGNWSFLSFILDRLPNSPRIGLSYLLGGNGRFINYSDAFCRGFEPRSWAVKGVFAVLLAVNIFCLIFTIYKTRSNLIDEKKVF